MVWAIWALSFAAGFAMGWVLTVRLGEVVWAIRAVAEGATPWR